MIERLRTVDVRVRWIAGAIAALVALNVLAVVLDAAAGGGGARGPGSSSYTTGPDGLAAYSDLLSAADFDVRRLRSAPSVEPLDPAATVVVLNPDGVQDEDVSALTRFVADGGRLIAGGSEPERWLSAVVSEDLDWDAEGSGSARPLAPVAETAGVGTVLGSGTGSWRDSGGALPILGGERPIASIATVGEGRVVLLADASPLTNDFLDRADNAAFGIGVAGDPDRPVLFAESFHGYGESGFYALPWRVRWLLAGLTLAALVWMVARGRRLGVAEEESRPLPPARKEYVDAVASILRRTGRRGDAIEGLRRRARAVLASRAGLAAEADPRILRAAAADAGLSDRQVRALFDPIESDGELIAAGEAFAAITKGEL